MESDDRLKLGGPFHGKILELAMFTCSFYQCFDCKMPYFGGMVDCQQQLGMEESTKKENLRCRSCQMKVYGAGMKECEKHGKTQIDWKCNYCCSIALFHCFGTTYFCDRCHKEYGTGIKIRDCNGHDCPLAMPHPPASRDLSISTFPLGCGICRSERLA